MRRCGRGAGRRRARLTTSCSIRGAFARDKFLVLYGQLVLSARVHEGLAPPLASTALAFVKTTCLISVFTKLIGWMFARSWGRRLTLRLGQIVCRQVCDGREIVLQLLEAKNSAERFLDRPNHEHERRSESKPMTKGTQLIRHFCRHGWTQEPGQERVVVNYSAALNVTNGFVSQ